MSSDCFKWGLIDDKLLQILGAPLLAPERHSACDLGARFPWFKKYKNNISLLHLYLVIIKLWHWISFKIGTITMFTFLRVSDCPLWESPISESVCEFRQCNAGQPGRCDSPGKEESSNAFQLPTLLDPQPTQSLTHSTLLRLLPSWRFHIISEPLPPLSASPLSLSPPPGCSPKPGSRPAGQYTSSSSSHNGGHRILPHIQPQLQNLPLSSPL